MKKYLILFVLTGLMISCEDDVNDLVDNLVPKLSATQILSAADSSLEATGDAFGVPSRSDCESLVTDVTTDTAGIRNYLSCVFSTNSMSPDTMRGSFHIISQIMSVLDDQVEFVYESDFTSHENISGSIEVSEGDIDVVVSIRERSVSTDWDFHVQICLISQGGTPVNSLSDCESGGFNLEIFLVSGASGLGFKTVDNFGGFNGGTSFILDIEEGQVRFEAWDEDNGRHQRMFVDGDVSTDLELGSISQVSVALVDAGIEDSGDGTDAIYAEFDGSNICANIWDDEDDDHSNGVGDGDPGTPETGSEVDLAILGTCSSFPGYDAGFFDASTSVEAYLNDEAVGPLSFDSSTFSVADYFIQ